MSRKRTHFVPTDIPTCCGKNRYGSKHQAEQVAEEQMLLQRDLELSVYRCTCGCGDWHLSRRKQDSSEILAI